MEEKTVTKFMHTCPNCNRIWGHSDCILPVGLGTGRGSLEYCWDCNPDTDALKDDNTIDSFAFKDGLLNTLPDGYW